MLFFCNTLVHRLLFHLPGLQAVERTLFRSPLFSRTLMLGKLITDKLSWHCASRRQYLKPVLLNR